MAYFRLYPRVSVRREAFLPGKIDGRQVFSDDQRRGQGYLNSALSMVKNCDTEDRREKSQEYSERERVGKGARG